MKRPVLWLILAFVATRVALVALTAAPINVASADSHLDRYRLWSAAVVGDGVMPYSEITIEHPPGSLPFVLVPELLGRTGLEGPEGEVGENHFRGWLVAVMVAVDVAGMGAALLLPRRTGVWLGAWVWVVGPFLLGPIIYLRLDLVPAVATLFAIERHAAGAAFTSGAFFGFGIASKLYPVMLLPAMLWKAVTARRFALGVGVVVTLALLPFVLALDDVWRSVVGYHTDRGIQADSSWGGWLLVAARRGYEVTRQQAFGATQLVSDISPLLKTLSLSLSVVALIAASAWVRRWVPRGDMASLSAGLYGILAVVMFFGSILSSHFVMWLLALGAAALSFAQGSNRAPLLLVAAIAALTQVLFPFNSYELVNGELGPLAILIVRNLLILGSGLSVLAGLRTERGPEERDLAPAPG